MNRIFFRIVPLILFAIAVAAFAIYFAIRHVFGDPLEDIARKQASGPIFLLEQYIDQAPADEWLVRLNKVREVSGLRLELLPLDAARSKVDPSRHAVLQRGELVLDIDAKSFYRRVDLAGERYVGSEEEVLQVSGLPIDVGLELKMELLRYAIVALCVLVPIGLWSRRHWLELLALSKVADNLGEGRLEARAATRKASGLFPLAARMNQMAGRIQELLGAHKNLLHSVSHELRTPITRIGFGLELLRGARDREDLETRIRVMEDDVQELDGLVNELLDLAKLDQGQTLRCAPFGMEELLRQCAGKVGHALGGKQLALSLPEGLGMVTGDRKLIARAVGNVLANAVKYANGRVAMSAARLSGGSVEVVIEDDGPGIPVEERERVFEAFHRLDRSRDRATGGFGLGLAIASRALRLHGGSIGVDDADGGGARFVLRIPACAVAHQQPQGG
ncbi:ATP-binding protein [Noviherbaspirillum sp.]|uniref:ATP-binding protein n=1 Tax=Noviherbaspirillum sp. TaxID=1926288 RepID=UPI002D629148|nr:ATP-binding protein [Noviherbaspirillum sp.]HZW21211.1 ATP-binding protein [Noviherbaspirillum sp.]